MNKRLCVCVCDRERAREREREREIRMIWYKTWISVLIADRKLILSRMYVVY